MVFLCQSTQGWVKNWKTSEYCQFFVILQIKILILKLNNSNFRQFSPESNQWWPNGMSILPEMGSKLVAVLTWTKTYQNAPMCTCKNKYPNFVQLTKIQPIGNCNPPFEKWRFQTGYFVKLCFHFPELQKLNYTHF